jgi:hypothetical protein
MEILQGNTIENGGKQNPKMGFKSPSEQRRKFRRPHLQSISLPILKILGIKFGNPFDAWAGSGAQPRRYGTHLRKI